MKTMLVLFLALSWVVALQAQDSEWYGQPEQACSSQGGQCLAKTQCEQPLGNPGELCPQQDSQGYQCCLGQPKDERRCRRRGGECMAKGTCRPPLLYSAASDCQPNQECCILV